MILYALAAFSKLQANLNTPYFDNDLIYAGYVCVVVGWGLVLWAGRLKVRKTPALALGAWSVLYVLLWGLIFTNEQFASLIYENAFKMLFMIGFVFGTAYLVTYYKCFVQFLRTSYVIQTLFVFSCLILHFGDIRTKNWIGNVLSMTATGARDKLGFGTHANILGLIILITFAVGLLLSEYVGKNERKLITICNLVMWAMLLLTAARMELLCCILLYAIIYGYKLIKVNSGQWVKLVRYGLRAVLLFFIYICLQVDKFEGLLMVANRFYAVSYYLNLYNISHRYLLGVGYVNYGKLPQILIANNLKMTFAECTWVDILATTGILGSIWLIIFYHLLIKYTMKSSYIDSSMKKVKAIAMLVCVILSGLAESVGFTDAYWISFSFLTICMCMIFSQKPKESFLRLYKNNDDGGII